MAAFIASGDFYSDSGIANAYAVSVIGSKQGPAALHDGMMVRFRPGNSNTTASTVNVNSLGNKDIVREDGSVLRSGDLTDSKDARLRYQTSGSQFLLLNRQNKEFDTGYISGGHMVFSVSAGVRTGACSFRTDDDTADGISSGFDKNFGLAFELGFGVAQGGFPPGAVRATAAPFGVFLLVNEDGAIEMGFDSDLAGTNLVARAEVLSPTGWSSRLIQILMSDETVDTDLEPFVHTEQDLSFIRYKEPVQFIAGETMSISAQTIAMPAPPHCPANVVVTIIGNTSDMYGRIASTEEGVYNPTASTHSFSGDNSGNQQSTLVVVVGDDSGVVGYETSVTVGTIRAIVTGYHCDRNSG
jgi:hypothetical protein